MKNEKPKKMNKLTALLYSSAGIGLITVALPIIVRLTDTPKNPRPLGE